MNVLPLNKSSLQSQSVSVTLSESDSNVNEETLDSPVV
jgi:hypothetical protein